VDGAMRTERDESARARALLDEAWQLVGGDSAAGDGRDVHVLILARIGLATYYLREHEFTKAVEFAERGLSIADRLRFVAWAIHRLLPALCDALIWLGEYERARAVATRLRAQSSDSGHPLGLAAADAADALLRRFRATRPWIPAPHSRR
jgi:hypothetical protein